MAKAILEIRSLARAHTETAIGTLSHIMRQESAPPSARVAAAQALLDRGWGKAEQTLVVDRKHAASDYTRDELVALIHDTVARSEGVAAEDGRGGQADQLH